MATASPSTAPGRTRIARLICVRRITALENAWIDALQAAVARRHLSAEGFAHSEDTYSAVLAYLKSLQFLQTSGGSPLDRILDIYRVDLAAIHDDIRRRFAVYIDLTGGPLVENSRKRKKSANDSADALRQEAAAAWETWAKIPEPDDGTRTLLRLRQARDRCDKGTPLWRQLNRRLLAYAYDALSDTVNAACPRIRQLFESVLFRESAGDGPFQQPAAAPEPDPYYRRMWRKRVEDWVRGYHPASRPEQELEDKVFQELRPGLSAKLMRRRMRQSLQILTVVIAIAGAVVYLRSASWDNRAWDSLSQGVKKMFGLDPASVRMKEQQKFFADQIASAKKTYTEDSIRAQLRAFENLPPDTPEQEKALFLAENVLRGYILLLADWDTSKSFTDEVLKVLQDYDADIHHHVDSLTYMFASPQMTESHFQIHALLLRRAFTNKGVFPFLFLSLYKNQPYVFLYPERIIDEYYFNPEHMEELGLNVAWYSHAGNIPLVAHIIEGKRYPFKDRAGYFEGQYAIVFNHIADNTRWTALHEFGHSLDQMRFQFGNVAYPLNVESHSMLMPVIFAHDPHGYIDYKLIGSVRVADPQDLYVQAAKGILNGFLLRHKETDPTLNIPLIGDDFNLRTIERVRQWIAGLSDEDLRATGKAIYRDSRTYLATAKGGTYRGHFTNAEEIVAGAHGPPTQSFLVDEVGDGDFTSGGSTRFIRDNQQDSGGPKDFWSFIKAVIYITLHPKATTNRRDSLEALVSSILIFVLVEALLMLVQWWGSPLRRRKYNGVLPKDIIRSVYDRHPWSDGRSDGEAKGERRLLEECFPAKPAALSPELTAEIASFKAAADKKRQVLFDVLLTLAPAVPQRSAVKTRRHNLLFWLPFIGPVLARWAWLMPRQRPFHQREAFNARIRDLCLSVRDDTALEVFLDRYKEIVLEYQSESVTETAEVRDDIAFMDALDKQIHEAINAVQMRLTLRKPMVTHRAVQNYHEDVDFDRLDKYVFGDDIKRIDWRATARAVNNEPVVRKSASVYGLNVGFLMDFRDMHSHGRREQFALDFIKSLRMLGKDRNLRQLIFIMPNGEIFHRRVHIKLPVTPHARAHKLWATVRSSFEENVRRGRQLNIPGLRFYSDEENAAYRERYKLTEFPYRSTEGIVFEKLALNNLNVFLIGMEPGMRNEVPEYLPGTNQVFFW